MSAPPLDPLLPSESEPLARALRGQYELEREVGRGGMGVVYLARDLKLERPVAIKTLPRHLAADVTIRDRFLREARTAAALSHPNIVPVHRADEIDGEVFFVMGYVDGVSLAQRLRDEGPLTPSQTAGILRDVAAALAYAHDHGVIHRDVKAENILLDRRSGRAMVTDFGIARLAEAKPLTMTGTVLGTVYYMSPEQVVGEGADRRSDIYALGVAGFLALTGRFPFESETPSAILVAHVTAPAPAVRSVAPSVPAPLAAIVDRCLAKNPAERFASCDDLIRLLDDAADRITAADDVAAPRTGQIVVTETAARAVWERAAQLQSATSAVVPPPVARLDAARQASLTSGYSLDEVREGAAGAGIASEFVARAMVDLGLGAVPAKPEDAVAREAPGAQKNRFLGEATSIAYEIAVPGEMSERDFDVMADVIRRSLNDAGHVSAVGRSLNWMSADKSRKVTVSVLIRGGKTTIHASERLNELAGGLFGGIMGGGGGGMIGPAMGIGMGALHSPVAAIGIAAGCVGAAYGIARLIFTRVLRSRRDRLRRLLEQLAEQARESIAANTLAAPLDRRRLPR